MHDYRHIERRLRNLHRLQHRDYYGALPDCVTTMLKLNKTYRQQVHVGDQIHVFVPDVAQQYIVDWCAREDKERAEALSSVASSAGSTASFASTSPILFQIYEEKLQAEVAKATAVAQPRISLLKARMDEVLRQRLEQGERRLVEQFLLQQAKRRREKRRRDLIRHLPLERSPRPRDAEQRRTPL